MGNNHTPACTYLNVVAVPVIAAVSCKTLLVKVDRTVATVSAGFVVSVVDVENDDAPFGTTAFPSARTANAQALT